MWFTTIVYSNPIYCVTYTADYAEDVCRWLLKKLITDKKIFSQFTECQDMSMEEITDFAEKEDLELAVGKTFFTAMEFIRNQKDLHSQEVRNIITFNNEWKLGKTWFYNIDYVCSDKEYNVTSVV